MWDPAVYHRYGSERARPFGELVARIGAERPRSVVDLGCGPGELTAGLAQRWPEASITGIDSSPEMIGRAMAHATGSGVRFEQGDVREWRPGPEVDVLVTNAVLQWIPEHRDLLARWVAELPAGAWLAMQVPGNFDAPSHRLLREVAERHGVGEATRGAPVDEPSAYAEILLAAGAEADAWETIYVHLLKVGGEKDHPVLRWIEGTALRPVKAALDENAWESFRADLGRELTAAYPAAHGYVAFPFRRIFTVGRIAG